MCKTCSSVPNCNYKLTESKIKNKKNMHDTNLFLIGWYIRKFI